MIGMLQIDKLASMICFLQDDIVESLIIFHTTLDSGIAGIPGYTASVTGFICGLKSLTFPSKTAIFPCPDLAIYRGIFMCIKKKQTWANIFILGGLFFINSCGKQPTSPEPNPFPANPNYAHLSERLDNAYQQNSQALLDSFFVAWDEILPSYTPGEVATFPDTIAEAYKIFIEYYSPTNLFRLTAGQHENFETDFRYVIVQNNLQIAVVDTNPRYYYYRGVNISKTYLDDFRPTIAIEKFPAVYLSSGVDSIIFYFLFNRDSTYKEDHQARVDYLRKAMQLTHHHWIRDYHKTTMPYASDIILNDSLTKALVHFRVFYQFGEAYLERRNGSWILISSELTGIE